MSDVDTLPTKRSPLRRIARALVAVAMLLVVAAASIAFALQVTPERSVTSFGQTVTVGTAPPTWSTEGPGQVVLFGFTLPTQVRFIGPVRPRLTLTDISINEQVAGLFSPGPHAPVADTLGAALERGWRSYFLFEIGFVALGATLLLGAIAGWRRFSTKKTDPADRGRPVVRGGGQRRLDHGDGVHRPGDPAGCAQPGRAGRPRAAGAAGGRSRPRSVGGAGDRARRLDGRGPRRSPAAPSQCERRSLPTKLLRLRRDAGQGQRLEGRQPELQRGHDRRGRARSAGRGGHAAPGAAGRRQARRGRVDPHRQRGRQRPALEHADPSVRLRRHVRQPRADGLLPAVARRVHDELPGTCCASSRRCPASR